MRKWNFANGRESNYFHLSVNNYVNNLCSDPLLYVEYLQNKYHQMKVSQIPDPKLIRD